MIDSQKTNPHIGSSFDEFLDEEGYRTEVDSRALKRVSIWEGEERKRQDDDAGDVEGNPS